MDEIERLEALVKKLKNNDENVPKQELETKYEKPYKKLKQDIKELAEKILYRIICEGLVIKKDNEGYRFLEDIRKLADEKNQSGIGKKLGKILYSEYDVDKFLDEVLFYRKNILDLYELYHQKNKDI